MTITSPSTATKKKHSDKRRLQLVAGVRVDRSEMEQIRARAERDGQTVSNYIRSLVINDLRQA